MHLSRCGRSSGTNEIDWFRMLIIVCSFPRYNEIFFMIDTCQAASMYEKFYSPNILSVGSSLVGEDSLSHHVDPSLGVYVIDRYTYYALEFLEQVGPDSTKTMGDFLKVCPKRVCISTVGTRTDLYPKDPNDVRITDFFGSIRPTEILSSRINITIAVVEQRPRSHLLTAGSAPPKKYIFSEQFPSHMFK